MLLFVDYLISLWIYELQLGLATGSFLTSIENAGRDLSLITHTDKARHIRLYHDVFLGHCLTLNAAKQHVDGIGDTHETPSSQTLGQRELHGYLSLFVCRQHGITEGGLVQVLAHLDVFFLLRFFRNTRYDDLVQFSDNFFGLQNLASSFVVSHHIKGTDSCFLHHRRCSRRQFSASPDSQTLIIHQIVRIYAIVEMAERQILHSQWCLILLGGRPT